MSRATVKRLFWRWMGRRWRVRETKWTRAAYSAGAWDADLCREAWEQAVRCAYRAAECERVEREMTNRPMPKPLIKALGWASYEPGDVVEWYQSGPEKYVVRLKADLTTVNVTGTVFPTCDE